MMTILTPSSWTTFLDCAPLGEDSYDAPPYATMGETLFDTSSLGHYRQMSGKLRACDIFMMIISNLYLIFLMTITT